MDNYVSRKSGTVYSKNPKKDLKKAQKTAENKRKRVESAERARKWFGKGKGLLGHWGVSDEALADRKRESEAADKDLRDQERYNTLLRKKKRKFGE